ncbi:phosphatidylserine decarboxylase [Parvicella tangerina]|uniref:Phosphatidylserine decarboxylase proenzyme n=1 Tax=Parvicella tangerina TaxID=2829795 RepID=A0A916NQT0_9FLAO|nr:phosphatidylserine decarboxylase [Parvicella tangerina]CAG5079815.1 Phosphatidylserine decarboxylase proenzyme [Parvicella tangerina]
MTEIKYINRETNSLETEEVPGSGAMHFLYGNPIGKFSLWFFIKRKVFSSWFGKYMSSKRSAKKIPGFVESHNIDLSQYVVPDGGFQSFNDFFYRKIKADQRPIGEGVISPADGRILVFPTITDASKFYVKGKTFDLIEFLRDEQLAQLFNEGSLCVVRLAPVDYHRYHFPVGGVPSESKLINGYYYSVSPIALQKNFQIFLENKREYSVLKTASHGKVLICDVGATLTAGIQQTYVAGKSVNKGDEKGYFYFGGSTLILLFEKDAITFSKDLIENTHNGFETLVKMGETIGK